MITPILLYVLLSYLVSNLIYARMRSQAKAGNPVAQEQYAKVAKHPAGYLLGQMLLWPISVLYAVAFFTVRGSGK